MCVCVHDFRMEAADEKRWSVTVSDLQAWIYILDCQLLAMREKHFFFSFFPFYGLFGGSTCGVSVWNG